MAIHAGGVGTTGNPVRRSWSSKDTILYALGVGAGIEDLEFTTENTIGKPQRVLPTFSVIVGTRGLPPMQETLGSFEPAMQLHGGQGFQLFGDIPTEGEIETTGKIAGVWDKGHAAMIDVEHESINVKTGEPIMKNQSTFFVMGAGGFGGERGSATKIEFPDTDPTHRVTHKTSKDIALTYRLSGDRNPLHHDPAYAAKGGHNQPIMHGLCTYGFAGRALLVSLCGNDPSLFKSMHARFSKPVIAGDELTTSIWVDANKALFRTTNQKNEIVLDQGTCSFV